MAGLLQRHVAEVALFLYMFGVVMQWPVTQMLILDKACEGAYSQDVCASLAHHPEIEAKVQTAAASWLVTLPSVTGILTAFSSLILGPASDRFGRNRVIMLTCICGMILALCFITQTFLMYLSPTLLLFGSVAMGLSGGVGIFLTTLFDFITDTTPADDRTRRLSIVQPFAGLGTLLGMLSSGIVSQYLGFRMVYIIFLCAQAAVLIIASKYMTSSGKAKTAESSGTTDRAGVIAGMVKSLTAGVRMCMKPRPGNKRKHIMFLLLCGVITMVGQGGDMGLTVLYTRRAPFHWEPTTLGYFTAAKNAGLILGMALGTRVLLRIFGSGGSRDDLTLMQIGNLAVTGATLVMSMATNSLHLMLVPILSVLSGPSQAAAASFSSKLVQPTEKGAFSSFSSFLNNLAMPLGTTLSTTIYSWTSPFMPGLAYQLQAAMYIIPLVLVTLMKADIQRAAKIES